MGTKENMAIRVLAADRAAAEPLPGPLKDAFCGEPVTVGGLTIRKAVHADWVILERLNSPIYQEFLEAQKPEGSRDPVKWSQAEQFELVYLFTRPVLEAKEILDAGRKAFSDEAFKACSDLSTAEFLALVGGASRALVKNFQTAVSHEPEQKGEDGSNPFPVAGQPPAKTA